MKTTVQKSTVQERTLSYEVRPNKDISAAEQDARLTSLAFEVLHDPESGLFNKVPQPVIDRIIGCSHLATFQKGQVLFLEGQDSSDIPLHVVLSGEFEIRHRLPDGPELGEGYEFATDKKGFLCGDVEFLTRGLDLEAQGRRHKNQALSTVVCQSEEGATLAFPQQVLMELIEEDLASRLMLNMARMLSLKLLWRERRYEKDRMPPRQRVVMALRQFLMTNEIGELHGWDREIQVEHLIVFRRPIPAHISRQAGVSHQNVLNVFRSFSDVMPRIFFCDGTRMEISTQFLNALRDEPQQFF